MSDDEPASTNNKLRKKVVIIPMSGLTLLHFSGPVDVFTNADKCLNLSGSKQGYEVVIASPTLNKHIPTLAGAELVCQQSVLEITIPIDIIIVAGNDFQELKKSEYTNFCNWLSSINEKSESRICSVCGGAFVLAEAGLLNGKKATTHWQRSEQLKKEYPLVEVNANPFYTADGKIYTSGGVSSGIDLALALVEEDHGKEIAIQVARRLVFYLSRPGFQAQFGNQLPVYESNNIAQKLYGWLHENVAQPLDVVRIAKHLNMSPRNFTRVFHKQTGIPPAKFIEKLRVEMARKYLEDTDVSIENIAIKCGLSNLVSMRRTFLRHLMVTPSDYRRAFRTSLQSPGINDNIQCNLYHTN